MDRLLELLARLELLSEIDRAELDDILAELTGDVLDAVLALGNTPEAIEALGQIATATEVINAEIERQDGAEAAAAAEAAALVQRIRGSQDPDPDGDPDAEDPPVDEPEVPVDPEVPAEPEARVPVAASATPAPAVARRPVSTRPRAEAHPFAALGLTASANNGSGVAPGHRFLTPESFGSALVEAWKRSKGYRGEGSEQVVVASLSLPESAYEGRVLGTDPVENARVLDTVQKALVAAGGICAPLNVDYNMPVLGSKARPVRDQMMTRFSATRGGIRTIPSPTLANVTAQNPNGVSVWTEAIDAAWTGVDPNDDLKPCVELDCPTEVETLVEAIVMCMTYANFRARFFPEQITAWMDLLGVLAARFAEGRLLDKIRAGSLALTAAANISTVPDILSTMLRVKAGYRDRHRLEDDTPFTWGVPHWLPDLMITDLIRRMPAHNTHEADLAVARTQLRTILSAHGLNMVPYLDSSAAGNQEMPTQSAGVVVNYPAAAETFFYPSGAWKFLDGGELNIGLVRDSTLNASNRAKFFAETFEGAHLDGPESLMITHTTIAKGAAGALVTVSA